MYNAKTPNHHAHVQYIGNVTNTKHFLESPNNYNLQVVIFLLQLYMYIFHEFKIQLKVDKWLIETQIKNQSYTVEPRFYNRRSNLIPDLTINILCPGRSYLYM